MTKNIKKWVCCALLVPSMVFVACNKKWGSFFSAKGQSVSPSRPKIDKQQAYVKVLNATFSKYHHVIKQYYSWCVDECEANGPTGKEANFNRGVTDIVDDPKSLLEDMRKTAKQSPSIPELDQAALKYADAIEKLYPVIRAASLYYKHEDYKTDEFKKAKELHQKIGEYAALFVSAHQGMDGAIDQIEDEMFKEDLARMDPQSLRYLVDDYLLASKQLFRLAEKMNWTELPSDPTVQKVIEHANVVIEKWKALDTLLTTNPEKVKKELGAGNTAFDLTIPAENMKNAAKEMVLRLQKSPNERFTDSEIKKLQQDIPPGGTAFDVKGSLRVLRQRYNQLVVGFNKLKFKVPN